VKHVKEGKCLSLPLNDSDSAEALVEKEKNDPNYAPT